MVSALFTRRMLICVFTGFSSGLPLYLLLNPAAGVAANGRHQSQGDWRIRADPVSLHLEIPLVTVAGPLRGAHTWPAPGLDAADAIGLLASIAWLGTLSPRDELSWVIYAATAIAFLSATQDIAVDAYRRELLSNAELGLGNAVHVNAYRIAGLIPGSLSLILADHLPWPMVFMVTALFMLPGMVMTLLVAEPAVAGTPPKTLRAAVVEPFREFIGRAGVSSALLVLAFIFLYKLGDSMCTALATPFYLDMGFSKSDIGLIAKNAGLWPSVIGALLGGLWMMKLGINRGLWLFGVVQVVSIFGFAWLSRIGPFTEIAASERAALALVIGFEALASDWAPPHS
jgi:PAT family beta-lactamase induction signal transducer AmpG